MFCTKCGKELATGVTRCPNCGSEGKMKMKRKVLSLLLCGVMICSMLTACGSSDDSYAVEPSIYTELTVGESSLKDTLAYLYSVTADISESSYTGYLNTAYGKFVLGFEGKAYFSFDENDDEDARLDEDAILLSNISHIKIPYSDSDDLREKGEALISYFDKLYTRGVCVDWISSNVAAGDNSFPAYILKDSADSMVVLCLYPCYTEEKGYFIDCDMESSYTFSDVENAREYFSSYYYWFDSDGNAYQPEFYKTDSSIDNSFSIDDIDFYTF